MTEKKEALKEKKEMKETEVKSAASVEILEKIDFNEAEDRFFEHFDLQYSTVSIIK